MSFFSFLVDVDRLLNYPELSNIPPSNQCLPPPDPPRNEQSLPQQLPTKPIGGSAEVTKTYLKLEPQYYCTNESRSACQPVIHQTKIANKALVIKSHSNTAKESLRSTQAIHSFPPKTFWDHECSFKEEPKKDQMRRPMHRKTQEQLRFLNETFAVCPNPTISEMNKIAEKTDLLLPQVRCWFANQRSQVKNREERLMRKTFGTYHSE